MVAHPPAFQDASAATLGQDASVLVRPLRAEDVEEAAAVVDVAGLALPPLPVAGGEAEPSGPAAWSELARHLLATDPGGCWVAGAGGGGVLGAVALGLRRSGLWALATLAVRPGAGVEVARAVLEPAAAYGAGALRGAACVGGDPGRRATLRLLRAAGHRLHPTMRLTGAVHRGVLPVARDVREGGPAAADFADAVDWVVRGAPHGPDHALLARAHTLLVAETATGRGYAYVRSGTEVTVLAATDASTARQLLWEALGRCPAGASVDVRWVTAEQTWAVDVGVAAGLDVLVDGFLCARGMRPPAPYVPSGALL